MTYESSGRRARQLELADAEGNLERPLLADEWLVPWSTFGVRDGCLEPDWTTWGAWRVVKAGPPMLERFARLADSGAKAEQAVVRYARRWGILDLCEHQLSNDHGWAQFPIAFATAGVGVMTYASTLDCRSLFGKEPVATWLYWSRQAAALLAILSRLRRSEPALSEDWQVLCEDPPWLTREPVTQDLLEARESAKGWTARLVREDVPLDLQRGVASGAIETWLRLAGVSLELRWSHTVPEVGFRGGGLLGTLGLQMLLAAVDSSGWLLCPGCGTLHTPMRTRYRRRSYCDACLSLRVPQVLASRRSRAKKAGDPTYREAERARVAESRRRKAAASTSSVGSHETESRLADESA